MPLAVAIKQAHFPDSEQTKDQARRRLAFDELVLIQLGVMERRKAWKESMPGHPLHADPDVMGVLTASLPFKLTAAQHRVIAEVTTDLEKSIPMSRIVQGEVGSGKTVVALAAIVIAVTNGQQAAFMAPTELLAEQHFRTVRELLAGIVQPSLAADSYTLSFPGNTSPMNVALLMGSTSRKRKSEVQQMVAQGGVHLLIGTHALFQKDIDFANLGLAIVDEQHRFGVMQRTELRQKGHNPHLLVMTATPIPRSLALTLYGDLDLSVIDELPPGRLQIKTRWLDASRRDTAYRFISREVESGRQAFIIYPLVEESEKLDVAAATEEHTRLSHDVFPNLRLGLLHGRMKQQEKDKTMLAFRAGELDVLISTAV
ncbi:MAG: recG, partial [Dehalococcoidia bacterium]|nr:recG [Dehalococcoidia bacterium]